MTAFECFTKLSNSKETPKKSQVIVARVKEVDKKAILQISGIRQGTLPLEHLGVPVKAIRLTKDGCKIFIDRICARVRRWTAKKLTYAGRG